MPKGKKKGGNISIKLKTTICKEQLISATHVTESYIGLEEAYILLLQNREQGKNLWVLLD
jgi:hypothetical protein